MKKLYTILLLSIHGALYSSQYDQAEFIKNLTDTQGNKAIYFVPYDQISEMQVVYVSPQEALRVIKVGDDILAKMSLLQLKSSVNYLARNAQESLQDMQCEQEVMRINAINMQANKEYVDIIKDSDYTQNWINYLQKNPWYADSMQDSIIASSLVKQRCKALNCLQADMQNQLQSSSILIDKANMLQSILHDKQNILGIIIDRNIQQHLSDMQRTIDEQVSIDQQAQFSYQQAAQRFQRYNLAAWYQNYARLKKAATMIQAQVRRQSAQYCVDLMRQNKSSEKVVANQIVPEILDDVIHQVVEKIAQNPVQVIAEQKIYEVPVTTETALSKKQAKKIRKKIKILQQHNKNLKKMLY